MAEYVHDAAMTWDEIGRSLGVSPQVAFWDYVSAMKKLRQSERIKELLEMAKSKDFAEL